MGIMFFFLSFSFDLMVILFVYIFFFPSYFKTYFSHRAENFAFASEKKHPILRSIFNSEFFVSTFYFSAFREECTPHMPCNFLVLFCNKKTNNKYNDFEKLNDVLL